MIHPESIVYSLETYCGMNKNKCHKNTIHFSPCIATSGISTRMYDSYLEEN
jgi:hypothetical protein